MKKLTRRFISLCLCAAVIAMSFATLLTANAATNEWKEDFEKAVSLSDTDYFSGGSTSIVDNGIDGKSVSVVTAGSYASVIALNLEKAVMKSGVTYTVSFDLKWTPDTAEQNSKWGFRVVSTSGAEIGWKEFFALDGAGGWTNTSHPVAVDYSGTVLEDRLSVTFKITPTENAYFDIWDCDGSGVAVIDNIGIAGAELITFGVLANEKFDSASSLDDTNYYSRASASVVENGIDGKSASISTSSPYEGILCMNSEKVMLKAGVTYKVSLNLKWTPVTEGSSSKLGFWLGTPDRTELAYLELFADTGAFCYSGSSVISYSGSVADGIVTSVFVFTLSQNAMFELWNSGGSAATVLVDNICIMGSEIIENKNLVSEKLESAADLSDTVFNTAGQVSVTENGIDGKSVSIVTAGGYASVISLNPEKALLKSGVTYTVSFDVKWTPDTAGQNSKWGFRVVSASGTEIGWKEFFALDGAGGWTNTSHPVAVDYSGTVLEDRLSVTFKITPTENAYFDIWDCDGGGEALIDNINIKGADIFIAGDVDGDHICNAADLTVMKKAVLGIMDNSVCDINADGSINVIDLIKVKKLAI